MAYATADDVAALLARTLEDAETALVERRLAQVERMIDRRITDLAERIDAQEIDLADVIDIEAEAVMRLVRDGDGLISETDGNVSYLKQANPDAGRLVILPEEWQVLGIRPSKMFQIAPARGGSAL